MATVTSLSQNGIFDDHKDYGETVVKALVKEEKVERNSVSKLSKKHDIVLKTFRLLVADLCEQFGGGHPGSAIGMAAIGVALWKYTMEYAPHTPDWLNRDRFVLSNGHACLFQYAFLHLTGYKAMTFEQLKSYHSSRQDALCPGHPEIEHEGIEVTTGPLGQGVANAVGLAMATKHLTATYNRPGFDIISNYTWCMVGDACLQEGIGLEAISLAGHFRLDNLTIIYDNNQITCDGSVDMTNTEDVNAKMRACGFEVFDIEDGCFDIEGLVNTLQRAKKSSQPTFVNVRTIIGLGSARAGDAEAHGIALGAEDVANMKRAYSFDPDRHLVIGPEVRDFFEELPARGEELVRNWTALVDDYSRAHPDLAEEFKARARGELPSNWKDLIPSTFPSQPTPSRKSNGLVFNPIASKIKSFMVGTADLSPSVSMLYPDKLAFQHPGLSTACGINGSYEGRYIHFGIREHAMASISNGLAAFSPNTIIPITSSFFMFYIYAAPGVRMGALQRLQAIHVATHDSIGMGEDGPTHQPIELAALYRAMPNILYLRPADSEETAGAWLAAIAAKHTPSIISTSRHALPQLGPRTDRHRAATRGAYVLHGEDDPDPDVTLLGAGAELTFAVDVAAALRHPPEHHKHNHNRRPRRVRVVSIPCTRLFDQQPLSYRRSVLRRHEGIPAVVIEAYASFGWERYADAGYCMRTERFGQSLPGSKVYEYFGFTVENLTEKVEGYLERLGSGSEGEGGFLRGEWVELNDGVVGVGEMNGKVE